MKVFKFGGASVKSADAVKNVSLILKKYKEEDVVVIVSAMGKMTNAFEHLINSYCYAKDEVKPALNNIIDFHNEILWDLFPNRSHQVYVLVNELVSQIEDLLEKDIDERFDKSYDTFIGYGELLSTTIIAQYLTEQGIEVNWIDARNLVKTNSDYRQATIQWDKTKEVISASCTKGIYISQGFIGGNNHNEMTSLGREGSDFTAAIFAYCLDAESVTIWKDVPGMLNADPKYYPNAKKLEKISYREAIELSYYGASVIHPKTIKPLQNKDIPLYVKSFLNPIESGSVIQQSDKFDTILPSFIFIKDQILLSITPRDFSFIAEGNISEIFKLIADSGIKVNLMQNSALNFSICIKNDERKVTKLIADLAKNFKVLYNEHVTLFTVRHYTEDTIKEVVGVKKVLLEQRTRQTARFILQEE